MSNKNIKLLYNKHFFQNYYRNKYTLWFSLKNCQWTYVRADIDECATNNGKGPCLGNASVCVNTPGSYYCSCPTPYVGDAYNYCFGKCYPHNHTQMIHSVFYCNSRHRMLLFVAFSFCRGCHIQSRPVWKELPHLLQFLLLVQLGWPSKDITRLLLSTNKQSGLQKLVCMHKIYSTY